jgi:hypothetical protein
MRWSRPRGGDVAGGDVAGRDVAGRDVAGPPSSVAYRLGVGVRTMPAPVIPEHAVEVLAGPLKFVVESRFLADDMAQLNFIDDPSHANEYVLDDGGASVHVFGTQDGLEHLRFDCFDKHPHYHYVQNAAQINLIVRIDEIALGDPMEWTMQRLRQRLPEMLDYAGASDLAIEVRAAPESVSGGVETVGEMLAEAQERSRARRVSTAK